jgi:phage-related protein
MTDFAPKPLYWTGSSRKDMRNMPVTVRRNFGTWLFAVQCDETPPAAESLKGLGGPGVLELVEEGRGGPIAPSTP